MLNDIPAPRVLRADRVSRDDREDMSAEDHRSQAQLLEKALVESCEYAGQLWNDLATMRRYLHDSLPDDPSPCGAAPLGPRDDAGWDRWQDALAGITSTLCGPRGDSGFGRTNAIFLARPHRNSTVVQDAEPASKTPDVPTTSTAAPPAGSGAAPAPARREAPAVAVVPAAGKHASSNPPSAESSPAVPTIVDQMREPLLFATIGAAVAAMAMRGRRGTGDVV